MVHEIPLPGKVIIVIEKRGCVVSRYVQTAPYELNTQPALNWKDLEPDARRAVHDQAGAPVDGDRLPCPDDLAARADWPWE